MGRSYTEEEKRQIVAGFFVSGLTQEEYARQRGVSVSTFRHWLSELYSKSDLDPFVLSPKLSVCPATARAGRCGDAQISRYLREVYLEILRERDDADWLGQLSSYESTIFSKIESALAGLSLIHI